MSAAAETGVQGFLSPFEVPEPEGCEGWESMFPYYALFSEERRESEERGAGSATACISPSRCSRSTS